MRLVNPTSTNNWDNFGRGFTRVVVMLGCFGVMGVIMYVYLHIDWKLIDGASASQLGGVLGIILGGALSMANSVIGYDFGSSQGSEKKSEQIASIVAEPTPPAPGTIITKTTTMPAAKPPDPSTV